MAKIPFQKYIRDKIMRKKTQQLNALDESQNFPHFEPLSDLYKKLRKISDMIGTDLPNNQRLKFAKNSIKIRDQYILRKMKDSNIKEVRNKSFSEMEKYLKFIKVSAIKIENDNHSNQSLMFSQNPEGDWIESTKSQINQIKSESKSVFLISNIHPKMRLPRLTYLLNSLFKNKIKGIEMTTINPSFKSRLIENSDPKIKSYLENSDIIKALSKSFVDSPKVTMRIVSWYFDHLHNWTGPTTSKTHFFWSKKPYELSSLFGKLDDNIKLNFLHYWHYKKAIKLKVIHKNWETTVYKEKEEIPQDKNGKDTETCPFGESNWESFTFYGYEEKIPCTKLLKFPRKLDLYVLSHGVKGVMKIMAHELHSKFFLEKVNSTVFNIEKVSSNRMDESTSTTEFFSFRDKKRPVPQIDQNWVEKHDFFSCKEAFVYTKDNRLQNSNSLGTFGVFLDVGMSTIKRARNSVLVEKKSIFVDLEKYNNKVREEIEKCVDLKKFKIMKTLRGYLIHFDALNDAIKARKHLQKEYKKEFKIDFSNRTIPKKVLEKMIAEN